MKKIYLLFLMMIMACFACSFPQKREFSGKKLSPLQYNNPGLVVDLGVGLWAWPLPMDYDQDGDLDLVVSCPDTPFNGLYFFENTSGGKEKLPVFESPRKIGPGKKNLQVCYVNGEARIMGPGVEYKNFKESLLNNPEKLYSREKLEDKFERIRFSQWKYVDYDNDDDLDIIVGLDEWGDYDWNYVDYNNGVNAYDKEGKWKNRPLHGYVFLIENIGGEYKNKGKIMAGDRPIDVYGAPSPNMIDFDGDGDLDIICGEFLDRFTWFENIGSREKPVYAEGKFLQNSEGIIKMDLEMIIPVAVDWDGDGDVDLVVGDEDGRVALVENTGEVSKNMPVFNSPVYFQQHANLVKFGALATPFAVDWDADGDQDLICGNTAGYIGFIENLDGGNPPKWNRPVYLKAEGEVIRIMAGDSGSIKGPSEKKWGYTTLSVSDWDGDGLRDIIINSIWGKIQWFENIGSEGSPVLSKVKPILVEFEGETPKPAWNWWDPEDDHLVTQWRTTPFAIDWNYDGLTDLVMLDPEGYLSFYERFLEEGELKLMPGKRIFYGIDYSVFDDKNNVIDSTGGPLRLNQREIGGSGRRKICITDWDRDGDYDLLVNSKNISLFENTGIENGKVMFKHHGPLADQKLAGHTTSPTIVNWDMDDLPDLLIGAEDGHFYYYPNNK
ncbi:MAG: VCBS repeat-containing protein [Bacteroidales bacterium]|nr:VCBS repeat-containing protein [Bacteroidales bacterium]